MKSGHPESNDGLVTVILRRLGGPIGSRLSVGDTEVDLEQGTLGKSLKPGHIFTGRLIFAVKPESTVMNNAPNACVTNLLTIYKTKALFQKNNVNSHSTAFIGALKSILH